MSVHLCVSLVIYYTRWTLNPSVLTRLESSIPTIATDAAHQFQPFQVDDVVKMIADTAMVKRMQKGHGEWVESMREVGVASHRSCDSRNNLLDPWQSGACSSSVSGW